MIYHCDCGIGFFLFDNETVDLIVTDPPYGVDYKTVIYNDSPYYVSLKMDDWLWAMHRVLKDGSHLYIFVPTLQIDKWVRNVRRYFNFKNLLAFQAYKSKKYMKDNFDFNLQLIIYASKGKAKRLNKVDWIPASAEWLNDYRNQDPKEYTYEYPSFNPKYYSNIRANAQIKKLHPNQKNEELCRHLIELSSKEGDVVLDPFCGCGTVPLAAESCGRIGEGFEQNFEMYQLALRRYVERDYLSLSNKQEIGDMMLI